MQISPSPVPDSTNLVFQVVCGNFGHAGISCQKFTTTSMISGNSQNRVKREQMKIGTATGGGRDVRLLYMRTDAKQEHI